METDSLIESLTERIREQLRWFDARALIEKRRALALQLCLTVSATAVPVLLTVGRQNDAILTVATILAGLIAVLAALQSFLNPGSRWEQYRLFRYELRKQLLDLELLSLQQRERPEAGVLDEIRRRFLAIQDLQRSAWFIGEPAVTGIESVKGTKE